jgi:uncharacterized membrane protein HdeD (DUF308 family)
MVKHEGHRGHLAAWTGLISGPGAWAISTQLNFALSSWQCGKDAYPVLWIGLLLALTAVAGGLVSLRLWRQDDGTSLPFAAAIATLTSFLFALVIVAQSFAGLVFTGCER